MKRILSIVSLCLAVAVTALAQGKEKQVEVALRNGTSHVAVTALAQGKEKPADPKPAAALPSVDQILDKYVQAIGGKAAIEKLTSRVSKGSFEIPAFGASGTAEIYEKAPNKTVAIINVAGFGVVQEGFDGKVGWAQDPQSGLREKSGAELAASKLEAEFQKPIKIKQLYAKIVVKGKDKVGDKEVYVVEATPAESSTETWYFDTQSGLMLRQDADRESPQGKQNVQVFLDNYKEVDGVKLPFAIHQITPAFTIDIKIEDVKHNVPIDDAKFVKPAA